MPSESSRRTPVRLRDAAAAGANGRDSVDRPASAALSRGLRPTRANHLPLRRWRPLSFMPKNVLMTLDEGHPCCEGFVKHSGCWMIGRRVRGWSGGDAIARLSFGGRTARLQRRRRRTLVAFLTGCGFLVLGFCSLRAGVAAGLVDSFNDRFSFVMSRVGQSGAQPDGGSLATSNVVWSPLVPRSGNARDAAAASARTVEGASSLPRRSVCVRLCDGYYFPIGPLSRDADLSDHEAVCSGLCPDAPTQLFIEPSGSDRIEDAVAADGARYVALPAAFRNRATVDKICACPRRPGQAFPLLDDFTLRKGDSIMTPSGIAVFRGAGHSPYVEDDFATLANAAMPRDRRAVLAAIERAALPNIRQSSEAPSPPPNSEIALAGPSPSRSAPAPPDKSIRFIEPAISASN